MENDIKTLNHSTENEAKNKANLFSLFKNSPIPDNEILANLGLFLNRQTLSRFIFMHELYQQIISVHGIIVEFGVRWGQNLALFESFRGMYEPYNYNRKIVGFDTFSGFESLDEKDGKHDIVSSGAYSVTQNYELHLNEILTFHENNSPLSHLKKFELVKGNAVITIDEYLKKQPETIIALAYFDFDIYQPTKKCLEAIKGRLTKGSVIGFDELNYPEFPGETLAFKEVFGLDKYKIRRTPINPTVSYIVIE